MKYPLQILNTKPVNSKIPRENFENTSASSKKLGLSIHKKNEIDSTKHIQDS